MACGKKCKKSSASKRNRLVGLYSKADGARNAIGDLPKEYTKVRDIWCNIKPISGVERLADDKITEFVSTIFVADYLDVTDLIAAIDRSVWKLIYESVEFNITHVIDIEEQHKDVKIYATRGEAA